MKQGTHREGDNIKRAVGAIVFTVFALSLGDAMIKQISADIPLWQIFVIRSLVATTVLILVIKARFHSLSLWPRHVGWTALRSLLLTFMWVAYYAALPHVALSLAAAVYYTLPLFITLFAGLFLGEKVGLQGWLAVILGFCGVLLILRPDAEGFNAYAVLPLGSAILYAIAMILTRSKCQDESPLVLSLALNLSFITVGTLASLLIWLWDPTGAQVDSDRFLLGDWISMGPPEWLAILLLALAVLIGSLFTAIAYQSGPSSIVATFDFAYLAFAVIWGFLFFAEVPDAITVAGMVLIAGAGIQAVRR